MNPLRPPSRSRCLSELLCSAVELGFVLALTILPIPAWPEEIPTNVALHVVNRELLLFSAPFGEWTSIRLAAGERILQQGADGNVAAVVTSYRAIGFSSLLNAVDELRVPQDEAVEQFRVTGNLASILTRQRVLGFSALTGRWQAMDRFYLGR